MDRNGLGIKTVKRMRIPRNLEVWRLGTINYLEALKLQEKLVSDRKTSKISDTLLSLQHPLTYTLGKRRRDHNLLVTDSEIRNMGAELHYTQRGGDVTFHGPHQAILYPIISLRDFGLGARRYVENLESTMIELASLYGVKAHRGQRKCETGVWVGERKLGDIGLKISSGIASHGLAFNVDPDLRYYEHIVPCGIAGKGVTSLRKETDVVLPSDEVIQDRLVSCFARSFGYSDVIWKNNGSVNEMHLSSRIEDMVPRMATKLAFLPNPSHLSINDAVTGKPQWRSLSVKACGRCNNQPKFESEESIIGTLSFLIGASMGRGKGKGKKFALTNNNDDLGSGDDEKIPTQKRRGRPQKPLVDDNDEYVEKIEEDDDDEDVNGKKRKRNKPAKEKGELAKEESPNSARSNGFRHTGSRRKNKPHRAAEAGVECKITYV
ncbi:hypothetical protein OSB04_010052 [Centaurea solstitialis]|uniref:lipoyl(octanoyl) transferase n=1 Tax=Centaurea solstitialis TaxID=347529 RepID=A0AA38TEC5_9ASTR|nr:hypothetical protein OSB04_010052 [Centaurea solstitialis]